MKPQLSVKKNKENQSSSDCSEIEGGGGRNGHNGHNGGTISSIRNNTTTAVQTAINGYRRRQRQSCSWFFSTICATWRYSQLL